MKSTLLRLSLLIAFLLTAVLQPAMPAAAAPASRAPAPAPLASSTPARTSAAPLAAGGNPSLSLVQSVSKEPLLGGSISYTIAITNTGATPVTDRGYNLTISDTLPVGLSYTSATPTPTLVSPQANGSTLVVWDNVVDLEAKEGFSISLQAALASTLTVASSFTNSVNARVNSMPDNSGTWVSVTKQLAGRPQAIDINVVALQSSAIEQATGAGEMTNAPGARAGADWPYQYRVTVANNNVGSSTSTVASVTLPPGVAYLGNVTITPNPNSSTTAPSLNLLADGSLELSWKLGTLTKTRYADPVVITFSAAIPYRARSAADTQAEKGAFAGPMHGAIIPEDTRLPVSYEASAIYGGLSTSDGTISTPADDTPPTVTAAYATVHKAGSPSTVGIGTTVTWTLDWSISEYYTTTNILLTDVLPDGMTYITNSASLAPAQILQNTPSTGKTTIVWELAPVRTAAGQHGALTFTALVDPTYSGAPYAGQPVVSGDKFTNSVTLTGDWHDVATPARDGTLTPTRTSASVSTRMPVFTKEVWNPTSSTWTHAAAGFTGDTMRFRLSYASAADVDAKAIVIRDFLPRGMTYVNASASHTSTGTFSDGTGCDSAPTSPTVGTLGGLQYLEWRLCNSARGSTWQATIDAQIGDIPNVQPGWIVANFGKLTGQNTPGAVYSLRDIANTNYNAPNLVLTKSASPSSGLVGGQSTTFTISIKNTGPAAAYNLALRDTLPANLIVANSGGSASPTASSYTTTSGNPAGGAGGVLQWSSVASLAPGATHTFTYQATIPNGLPAGASMTNVASVAYNSRADNTGHQWNTSSNTADSNTKSATVYVRGLTVTKTATPAIATIGETVHWTLTGSVPTGVIGYWPVVQENSLPDGFAYIAGSTVVTGATLDGVPHHAQNPLGDGARELRWFLETIDNTNGASAATFIIEFDTVITGFKPGQPATIFYPNNCCLATATNSVYVGWYDSSAGYNSQGFAYDGLLTNRTTRRSPAGTFSETIRQPSVGVSTSVDHDLIGAGDTVLLTLRASNMGNSAAFDLVLTDTLPLGLTLVRTEGMAISYPAGFPIVTTSTQDTSTPGTANLGYTLDTLHVGATWIVTATATVDPAIAAGLNLSNQAAVTYSSRAGTPPDSNGDGQSDERGYRGPLVTLGLATPAAAVQKSALVSGDELTVGTPIVYTLTLPPAPINATIYSAAITDTLDSRLQITNVSGAVASGNRVTASYASIPPGEQRTIVISARVPGSSTAKDGALLNNTASFSYAGHAAAPSNTVANTFVAPALVVEMFASAPSVAAGDKLTYTATISNAGGGLASDLALGLTLPANIHYTPGSATLNGQPLPDPSGGAWSLPNLSGHSAAVVSFEAQVTQATAGTAYVATASAHGTDSQGAAIVANNQARVATDRDPDDSDGARVYGPLQWQTHSASVAFEDLKKTGWTDWDYNDFIVWINIQEGLTPAGEVAALKINYTSRARGAGFDHAFHHALPTLGTAHADLTVRDGAGQLLSHTSSVVGDEPSFLIIGRTKESLPPNGLLQTNTRPIQTTYLKGYTAALTLVLDDPSSNLEEDLPPTPWDPFIGVYDTGQDVHLVMPGHLDNTQKVNTAFDPNTPLKGYDLPLAQIFDPNWRWPIEYAGIWRSYPQYVGYVGSGGTRSTDWAADANAVSSWVWGYAPATQSIQQAKPSADAPESRYFGGPAVGDVNGDGQQEIALGNLLANRVELYDALRRPMPGWPQATGGGVKASPVLADLNKDGKPEILAGAEDGKVYAWFANGTPVPGWPVRVSSARILATPAVADISKDGSVEVVVPAADGKLYAFSASGALKAGWPVSIGNQLDINGSQVINSSPRIADLDGSGNLKIVVGSTDHRVYAFNGNGSLAWSYLTGDMILGAPAIADFDATHAGKEVAVASGDSYVYLLDKDGARIRRKRTGWTIRSTPLAADLDGDGRPELLVGGDDGKLYAWHGDGTTVAGWPQTTPAPIFGGPAVGDLDGDGKPEVFAGSDDAHVYAWHANGTPVKNWPRITSLAVKGRPVVAQMQAGAAPQVVVADFGGQLYAFDKLQRVYVPLTRR